jgi:large subunit ribosomal protein L24
MMKWKVRRGDRVMVMTGRDRGKTGEVIKVLRDRERLFVQGVHMVKKHQRPTQDNPQGRIVEKEASIHISNVMHVDPKDQKPTRVGIRIDEKSGKKMLFAKRSQQEIRQV